MPWWRPLASLLEGDYPPATLLRILSVAFSSPFPPGCLRTAFSPLRPYPSVGNGTIWHYLCTKRSNKRFVRFCDSRSLSTSVVTATCGSEHFLLAVWGVLLALRSVNVSTELSVQHGPLWGRGRSPRQETGALCNLGAGGVEGGEYMPGVHVQGSSEGAFHPSVKKLAFPDGGAPGWGSLAWELAAGSEMDGGVV